MPADQSLADYIKKCRSLSRTDSQIRADLLKVGWDAQDIDDTFTQLQSPASPAGNPAFEKLGPQPASQQAEKPKTSPLDLLPGQQKVAPSAQAQPASQTSAQQPVQPAAQPAAAQSSFQQQASQPVQQPQPAAQQPAPQSYSPQAGAVPTAQQSPTSQAQQPAKSPLPLASTLLSFLGMHKNQPSQPAAQPQNAQQINTLQDWQAAAVAQKAVMNPQAQQPQPAGSQIQLTQQSYPPQSGAVPTAQQSPTSQAQQPSAGQASSQPPAKKPLPFKLIAIAIAAILIVAGIGAFLYLNQPQQENQPTMQNTTNQTPSIPPIIKNQSATQKPSASKNTTVPKNNSTTSPAKPPATPPPPTPPAPQPEAQPTIYPGELGLPPGVNPTQSNNTQSSQSASTNTSTSGSSQSPASQTPSPSSSSQSTASTSASQAPSAAQSSTQSSLYLSPGIGGNPLKIYRDFGEKDNARLYCWSTDRNYLRAHYIEYAGNYCRSYSGSYVSENWTTDSIDSCGNRLPCCVYNSTRKTAFMIDYYQCDADP